MAEPNAAGVSTGLSDDAASGIAYLTFIPAIIFLVVAPYNTNPKIKFHAWQSIFLGCTLIVGWILSIVLVFIPILGWIAEILLILGFVGLAVIWILCVVKAFSGQRFVVPVIGALAEKQAGG
jgi:uncharacterized membrane protein